MAYRDEGRTLALLLNDINKPRIPLNLKCSVYILYFYSIIALDDVLREQHKAKPRCWAGLGCSPGQGWGAGLSRPGSKAGSSVGRTVRVPTQVVISQSLARPRRASAGFKHDSVPTRIFISSSIWPRHRRNGPWQAPRANRRKPTGLLGAGWEIQIAKYTGRKPPRRVIASQGAASGSPVPAEPQTGPRNPGEAPGPTGARPSAGDAWSSSNGGCFHLLHANPCPPKPAYPRPRCSRETSPKLASRSSRQRGSPTRANC